MSIDRAVNSKKGRRVASKTPLGRKLEFGTRINFKLTPSDKRKIQIIAKSLDMTMSDFIRYLLEKQIEKFELQQDAFKEQI
jgi:hypothetical protein